MSDNRPDETVTCSGCGKKFTHPSVRRPLHYRTREMRPDRFGRMKSKAVVATRKIEYCSTECATKHHGYLQMAHEG